MKVRVQYTIKFDAGEMSALTAYHGEKVSREDLKSLLQDLGVEAVMLQISEGFMCLDEDEDEDADEYFGGRGSGT